MILGAGLDTFAYRTSFGDRARIFEVDHPATQAWKRIGSRMLVSRYRNRLVPIDFERQSLQEGLSLADLTEPNELFSLGLASFHI